MSESDPKQTLGRSDVLLPFWARWPIMAQPQFRTIQVCPKDLPPSLREIELAANRPIGPSLWRTDDADS